MRWVRQRSISSELLNVCCVAAVVKNIFLKPWSVELCCIRGVMDVVFSVCFVTRGAVGACVWEV